MTDELRQEIDLLKAEIAALKDERLPKVDRASKRRDRRQVLGGFGMFLVAALWAGMLSASALSGSNTVASDDIIDGQVYTNDVKDNTLSGADIKESTLAAVCPAGLTRVSDLCYGEVQTVIGWGAALVDCADENLRLPSTSEAIQISLEIEEPQDGIATNDIYTNHADDKYYAFKATDAGVSAWQTDEDFNYACMTTVGARP